MTVETISIAKMNSNPATGQPALVARNTIGILPIWIALLLAGPAPLLTKLGFSLWDREQYQFFPLMIIGAALLAWERWQDRPNQTVFQPGSPVVERGLLALSLVVLMAGALFWVRSFAGVSAIFVLIAIAWRFGGWNMIRLSGPSLVLLLTIIPPPGKLEQGVTLRLQQMAVKVSSRMLDGLHVAHVQSGNILEIPGKRLLVEQACSGINSLMAVLAFSLLYGFWKRRSLFRIICLLPAAAFFVVWGNIVRITGEAFLKVRWKIDVLDGTKHELMGLGLFIGCVGLVASFDSLLGFAGSFVQPINRRSNKASTSREENVSSPARWPILGRIDWAFAIIFLFSGIWVQARVWRAWEPSTMPTDAKFDLPQTLAGWEKVKKAPMMVERPETEASTSFLWQYRRGDLIASVAIDYPFTGYHELTTCYRATGWTMLSRDTTDNADGPLLDVTMKKPPEQAGYLLFSQTDEKGESVVTPPDLTGHMIRDDFEISRRSALGGPTYQTQVLAQQYSSITADQMAATKELFIESRHLLNAQLLSQLGKK